MVRSFYVISVILLLLSFLFIKKYDKRVSIVREVIYSLGLFFCYNVVLVFFMTYLGLGGSLYNYTFVNLLISGILFLVIIKSKRRQRYVLNKKEILFICCFICCLGAISYYKSSGGDRIHYLTNSDPAIHYKSAVSFSRELVLLNRRNSRDLVFKYFNGMMPMSYVNGGFFIKIFDNMKPYKAFMFYDGLCYVFCSLLFLVTLLDIFKRKEKFSYLYIFALSLLYCLAFPLNSYLYGFCYLGLGVMAINMLLLSIFKFRDGFDKNIICKLIILFVINFSVFFSYYLFVPSIYLSLGIYYIVLYKKKEISLQEMFLYGILTLILPFIIGFCYFLVPFFMEGNTIQGVIRLTGSCYDNVTPIFLFSFFTLYLVIKLYKNELECNYLNLAIVIHTIYILIFLILYCFKISGLYYFYKLFFVYWVYVSIHVGKIFWKNKKSLYIIGVLLIGIGFCSRLFIGTRYVSFLRKVDIYNFNFLNYNLDSIMSRDELKLAEESIKYKNMCVYNNTFLMIGSKHKNYWYYAITGEVPVIVEDSKEIRTSMDKNSNTLLYFDYLPDYRCVVYYNEGNDNYFDRENYDILYENDSGAILKRTDEKQEWLEELIYGKNT